MDALQISGLELAIKLYRRRHRREQERGRRVPVCKLWRIMVKADLAKSIDEAKSKELAPKRAKILESAWQRS